MTVLCLGSCLVRFGVFNPFWTADAIYALTYECVLFYTRLLLLQKSLFKMTWDSELLQGHCAKK